MGCSMFDSDLEAIAAEKLDRASAQSVQNGRHHTCSSLAHGADAVEIVTGDPTTTEMCSATTQSPPGRPAACSHRARCPPARTDGSLVVLKVETIKKLLAVVGTEKESLPALLADAPPLSLLEISGAPAAGISFQSRVSACFLSSFPHPCRLPSFPLLLKLQGRNRT